MNILITGAKGFVGRNLSENLNNIRDGKNRTRPSLHIDKIFEYDLGNTQEELERYCRECDFVFNLAGVNRPKDQAEFMAGNFGFASLLLETLKKAGNKAPVMLSSSIQATLKGRYDGEYGRSKKAGEELFFRYAEETGAKVLVYRFTNVAGKWCRPNYNSAVATFCYNIANGLPVQVNDPATELELLFIDDLVEEMLEALEGREHRVTYGDGGSDTHEYCCVPVTHKVTLGEIVKCLEKFSRLNDTLCISEIPEGSFEKKLYTMYLSYLPEEKVKIPLKMNCDERGSFTEIMKSDKCGQMSVNVIKPGIRKGQHWHNGKWELFTVVSGRGLIRERKIGSEEVLEYYVSGDKLETIHILPGYTHSIENLSETEPLVTLMWANEKFTPEKPDTYFEEV